MKYELSLELLQKVVSILDKLPYGQVFQVLDEIRALKPTEEAKKDEAV